MKRLGADYETIRELNARILVQSRRDWRAAKRFFRKLLKGQGCAPRRLITDKLRSYSAAHRAVCSDQDRS